MPDQLDSNHRGVSRLRIVVFTAGGLSPAKRVFLTRLATDPLIDLQSIIVDDYCPTQRNIVKRLWRGLRRHGVPWLLFKLCSKFHNVVARVSLRLYDVLHDVRTSADDYRSFADRQRVHIHRTHDIHSQSIISHMRSLRPHLGVIFGGRILKADVIGIPSLGTLNIHKRKVPEYRGGGCVGYWELLHGESSIGVTIHFATDEVDAGPVLAQTRIPFESGETLDSIRIKADIVGTNLYTEVIRDFASGKRQGRPKTSQSRGTFRSAGEFREHQLNTTLRKRALADIRVLQRHDSRLTKARLLLQYFLTLPVLIAKRRRLVSRQRAPILMLYYHVVANRPVNHLCLPLEEFVRQIEFIRRYYEIISVEEATRRIRSGKNDDVAAVITFDDGYSDNKWAIEYLKFYSISACFFISTGHIRDQTPFQHDLDKGISDARPMSAASVRELACHPLSVGSHAVYHEDFGHLDPEAARAVLTQSKQHLETLTAATPKHFSFPKGLRGVNITRETLQAALAEYDCVYSAYGGYNFPRATQKHFVRFSNPYDFLGLLLLMDGYTGLTSVLAGDGWTTKTWDLPPYRDS